VQKSEFVDQVADKADIGKGEAERAVNAFLETVTETLKSGDSVIFTGFGKFSTSQRAARTGTNPSTRAAMEIPASTVPKFTAGSLLKQAVKG
jgi:DNA-binding protein HU-beta